MLKEICYKNYNTLPIRIGIFLFVTIVFSACRNELVGTNNTPFLEVNGRVLYRENLPQFSSADSAEIVSSYIKRWVIDVMMYDYAKKNIQDLNKIEHLVEEYRKTLMIQHYQQMLIDQRLESPTEEQIRAYYAQHSAMFVLDDNIMKGAFVKIPTKTSKIRNLQKWLEDINDENLEKIEKFCVNNYGTFDYFQDSWIPIVDVLEKMPNIVVSEKTVLATAPNVATFEDSVFTYFLRLTEYRLMGTEAPYDFADDRIKNILLNQKKIEFLNHFEEDLYQGAQKKINYFDNKNK